MVRIYLSILLLAMAAGQLLDVSGFADIIGTYDVGPAGLNWAVALGLIAGEVTAGAAMLFTTNGRRAGATIAVIVALAWSGLAVQAYARGLSIENCGCFGVYLGQRLSAWVLAQDALFIGTAVWAWMRTAPVSRRGNGDIDFSGWRASWDDAQAPTTTFVPVAGEREIEDLLAQPGRRLLFLHDPWCPISRRAKSELDRVGGEVLTVDVSVERELSKLIEESTRIRHQSPQAMVLANGQVAWHASHFQIKVGAASEALRGGDVAAGAGESIPLQSGGGRARAVSVRDEPPPGDGRH